MARMRMPDGSVYDVPDADVEMAQAEYGAVPDDGVGAPQRAGMGMEDIAPWLVGGGLLAGGAGALASPPGRRMLGQAGREAMRDRGPVGAFLRTAAAARPPARPSAPPTEAAPRPSAPVVTEVTLPKLPPSLTRVTEADIAKHPELRGYDPGQEISRKKLEAIKDAYAAQPSAPDRQVVKSYERTKPKPKSKEYLTPAERRKYGMVGDVPQPDIGTAESRVTKPPITQEQVNEAFGLGGATKADADEVFDQTLIRRGGQRHDIKYQSASKGAVDIEKMPISHLRNAINKAANQIGPGKKYTPTARATLKAMLDEVAYRAKEAAKVGMEYTVPDELPSIAEKFKPGLGKIAGKVMAVAGPVAMLQLVLSETADAAPLNEDEPQHFKPIGAARMEPRKARFTGAAADRVRSR